MRDPSKQNGLSPHAATWRTLVTVVVGTVLFVPLCAIEVPATAAASVPQAALETDCSSRLALIQAGPANLWRGAQASLGCAALSANGFAFGLPLGGVLPTHHAICGPRTCNSRMVYLLKRQLQV